LGKLVYTAICSLDGYVADAAGDFDWSMPDEEVHAFVNELSAGVGTQLLGRRMFDVLKVWDGPAMAEHPAAEIREFAEVWKATDKIVVSRSLESVDAPRTTLVREFDADDVRRRKAESDRDLAIGGPTLAAHAFAAGLVDEVHLFVNPVIVGGGLRALPDGVRLDLDLVGERRFSGGVVHLHYVRGGTS
jgi:dihydrofolate reductase